MMRMSIGAYFRDDSGRLVRTERLRTKDVTQRVKMKGYWQVDLYTCIYGGGHSFFLFPRDCISLTQLFWSPLYYVHPIT